MTKTADIDGFTRVARTADVREGGRGHAVFMDGVKVALFRQKNRLIAVGDRCPHMGASLSEGRLMGGQVQCHWHGWKFDVDSGQCAQKEWAKLPVYEVRVEGEDILLKLRAEETADAPAEEEPWMNWQPPEKK